MSQGIPVNPEQLRNQVQFFQAQLTVLEKELVTFKKLGQAERLMWSWLVDTQLDPGFSRTNLNNFLTASKEHNEALGQLKGIEIAKLKSQLAVAEAMLGEVERLERDSGRKVIV